MPRPWLAALLAVCLVLPAAPGWTQRIWRDVPVQVLQHACAASLAELAGVRLNGCIPSTDYAKYSKSTPYDRNHCKINV